MTTISLIRKGLCEVLCIIEEFGIVFEQFGEVPHPLEIVEKLWVLLGESEKGVPNFPFLLFQRFNCAVVEGLVTPNTSWFVACLDRSGDIRLDQLVPVLPLFRPPAYERIRPPLRRRSERRNVRSRRSHASGLVDPR